MKADTIIDTEVRARLEEKIRLAETGTSGEIRLHVEDKCPEDPLDRAAFVFAELEMHKTELRNGVLIYVAFEDRKLAIIGDAGINQYMQQEEWDSIYGVMKDHFKASRFEEGLAYAIEASGEKIRHHFPIQENDRNELSNTITTGKPGKA